MEHRPPYGKPPPATGKLSQIAAARDDNGKPTATRDADMADKVGGINVSVSLGTSKSVSETHSERETQFGRNMIASGNISITATGGGQGGNVLIQGAQISASSNANMQNLLCLAME